MSTQGTEVVVAVLEAEEEPTIELVTAIAPSDHPCDPGGPCPPACYPCDPYGECKPDWG